MKTFGKILAISMLLLTATAWAQSYEVAVKSPSYGAIPRNAVNLPILNVTLHANEDLYLSEMHVEVQGLMSSEDFGAVSAMTEDYYRSMRSQFLTDNRARLRFFTPVYIPAGTSKQVDILINMDASSGGRTFQVNLTDLIFGENNSTSPRSRRSLFRGIRRDRAYLSDAMLRDEQGERQQISSFDISEVAFSAAGSGSTIRMGHISEIAKFRLGGGDKDIQIQSIRFRNYGNADLDESFDQFELLANGREVPIRSNTEKNYLTIQPQNYLLPQGDTVAFSLRARLIYAQSGDTVELGIRDEQDFQARVRGTSFSARLTGFEDVRLQEHQLRAGGITLSRQQSRYRSRNYRGSRQRRANPVYQTPPTYNPGAKDVTFANVFFNEKTAYQVKGLFIPLANGTSVSDKDGNGIANEINDLESTYKNFRLLIDGDEVDSTNNFTQLNGNTGISFDTTFVLRPNTNIRIIGRITHEAISGDRIKFDHNQINFFSPELLSR